VKIFPSECNSFLNLSAPVLNFSGDEGKIFTFKPAQKSAGSAIKLFQSLHMEYRSIRNSKEQTILNESRVSSLLAMGFEFQK
jgi:hypothetical protein